MEKSEGREAAIVNRRDANEDARESFPNIHNTSNDEETQECIIDLC